MNSEDFNSIFWQSIVDYHRKDDITAKAPNPYPKDSLEYLLYQKNWIDTVQWHLEDLIREEKIEPKRALEIKREIDVSNQRRIDLVEQIDDYFFDQFQNVVTQANARLNTETPAWAIDRLSILHLKIYHMQEETKREDASEAHREKCRQKLHILNLQKADLSAAIDQLLNELKAGTCQVKTYRQMKMYNDPTLNPVLRKQQKK